MQKHFPEEVAKFERLAAKHLHQLPPSGNLYLDIPLFRDSPSRFLYKLDLYSERRIFYTGDVILCPQEEDEDENSLEDEMIEDDDDEEGDDIMMNHFNKVVSLLLSLLNI